MTAKQKAARANFKKAVTEAQKLRKSNPKLTQAQALKKLVPLKRRQHLKRRLHLKKLHLKRRLHLKKLHLKGLLIYIKIASRTM